MRIVLTFIVNAGLNLALGLVVASLLSGDSYGRFAIGNTVSVVLSMALFDWLRLSATRFYGERQRTATPAIRATLDAVYLALAAALVVATAVLIGCRTTFGLGPALLAAAAVAGLANGLFDYYAALARARFRDRTYAVLVVLKNVLAFGFAVGACLALRDPAAALAGLSVGALMALLPVHRDLRDGAGPRSAERHHLLVFARYGFPIVAANVIFQVVILLNRSVVASRFGYAEAGQLSLATDMTLRLFLAVGSALDVLIFQIAIRCEAEQGRAAALKQLRTNTVLVLAVLSLLAVGTAVTMPLFEAVLIPERYRGTYGPTSLVLLPGVVLFSLGQFAFNPTFQVAGRTVPILVAAVATLAIDAVALLLLPPGWGFTGVAAAHSVALGGGALLVAGWAMRDRALRPPLADIGWVAVAAGTAALAMAPLRHLAPAWLALGAATAIGSGVFGAILLVCDVAGARGLVRARLGGSARFGSFRRA